MLLTWLRDVQNPRPRLFKKGRRGQERRRGLIPNFEWLEDRCLLSGGFNLYPIPTAYAVVTGMTNSGGQIWFTESAPNKIASFYPPTKTFTEYTLPPPPPGDDSNTNGPNMIAADPSGNLWFTENNGPVNSVGKMTPGGSVTQYILPSRFGSAPGPAGITVASDGTPWFAEFFDGEIASLNPSTGVISEYAVPTANAAPFFITAGPDGNLWFTEENAAKIGRFNPHTAAFTEYSLPGTGVPNGIVTGPDGNLWFCDAGNGAIGQIVPSTGAITEFTLPQPNTPPREITVGSDNNLWFIVGNQIQLWRITTSGQFTFHNIPSLTSSALALSGGPDGNMWFSSGVSDNDIGQAILDQPLTATSKTIAPTEGAQFNGGVASFTDADPAATTSSFTATINWGDGSSSTGTIIAAGSGFTVSGSHTYSEEGSTPVTVTITDIATSHDIGGNTATASSTANIADAALSAGATTLSATEGTSTGTVSVAFFSDAGGPEAPGNYTATIDWGDKSGTTTGTVAVSGTLFTVSGSHTYAEGSATPYAVVVTITDDGGSSVTATGAATVQDFALTSSTTKSFNATEGKSVSAVLSSFHDTDPANEGTGEYSATITWGDGSTSAGTIKAATGTGNYQVSGTHTYLDVGKYPLNVTVTDAGGATVTASGGSVTVAEASIKTTGRTIKPIEGVSFSNTVASFTDANPFDSASDYAATITWGDGSSSAGVIVHVSGGQYNVTGTHTYAEEGTDTISVLITDEGTNPVTATSTASVQDGLLTAKTVAFNPAEGTVNATVATFTDQDPTDSASDYTAVITWGDGGTSSGSITKTGPGAFSVNGTYTYLEEGTYPFSVLITDTVGGNTAKASANVTVADASLSGAASSVSITEGVPFTGNVVTFTDGDPNGVQSDYAAIITWGDGNISTGTIVAQGSGFAVQGTHTYAESGKYTIKVSIQDAGGAAITVNNPITVGDAVPSGMVPFSLSATHGVPFGVVGSFIHTDANAPVKEYQVPNTAGSSKGTITVADAPEVTHRKPSPEYLDRLFQQDRIFSEDQDLPGSFGDMQGMVERLAALRADSLWPESRGGA
jgi:streptogramin lyase